MLGGASGASIVQQQLPRSLLEASGSMPWDAAAAACLRLLGTLLSGAAGKGEGEQGLEQLLQRAFSAQLLEAGAFVSMRALAILGAYCCCCGLLLLLLRAASAAAAGCQHPA